MNTTNSPIPAYMASSTDATKVSARVTGLVLAFSSIIILVAQSVFHIGLTGNDVISIASEAGVVAGAIWTLKGAIVWIMTKFGKQTPQIVTPTVAVDPATVVPPPSQAQ